VLEAGALLVSEHVQNLTQIGLDVADPIFGNQDNGLPHKIVWSLPWRGNQAFPALAYCVGENHSIGAVGRLSSPTLTSHNGRPK
jgi:hypothetical protein